MENVRARHVLWGGISEGSWGWLWGCWQLLPRVDDCATGRGWIPQTRTGGRRQHLPVLEGGRGRSGAPPSSGTSTRSRTGWADDVPAAAAGDPLNPTGSPETSPALWVPMPVGVIPRLPARGVGGTGYMGLGRGCSPRPVAQAVGAYREMSNRRRHRACWALAAAAAAARSRRAARVRYSVTRSRTQAARSSLNCVPAGVPHSGGKAFNVLVVSMLCSVLP